MDQTKPVTDKPLRRAFAFERMAQDEESRSVTVSFSSDAPYERFFGTEILDHASSSVRLGRLADGGALLVDHDTRDHVGVVERVWLDGGKARADLRFGRSARAQEVFQDVLDGIRRNVSVGYMVHRWDVDEDKGIYRATDWEPYEISLVAVPADASVGVGRSHDSAAPQPMEQKMTQTTAAASAAPAAPAAPAVDPAKIAADERAAERSRIAEILKIGADFPELEGAKRAQSAIDAGTSVVDFQREILEARRKAAPAAPAGHVTVRDNILDDDKRGFRDIGEFATAVRNVARHRGTDERLTRAATTFGNEASGPDGGYAIPPAFANSISELAYQGEASLHALCDDMPVEGNSMRLPQDETTPWGSSGIYAAWEGEGDQTTPKKPALKMQELYLRKLKVLVAASDELLADTTALAAHLTRKMADAVEWKTNDAIINGTGAGMPLGILNAACTVSQAKEGSQAADTIVAGNIAKMYGRVIMGAGANVVWLMNPDCFQQVMQLSLNSNPIWVPANQGFTQAPNGLLMGRPIILTDACDTVGDVGDIILANMSGYRTISKGSTFAESAHLWFDQDLMAFKLTFRMDGAPALSAAVTPPNSSVTRSHFVTLAARA